METAKDVNPHFEDFLFDWNSSTFLLVGGYGSSKSYHAALKIVLKLLSERRTALVVREVFETIRDSCFALLLEICESLRLNCVTFTRSPLQVNFQNGSKILFRGLDRPEKLKSIHDISLIWIEEASEIKYSAFKELTGRLRHPTLPLFMILSTNPAAKSSWVFRHFFENRGLDDERLYRERILRIGDTYYHHSTAADNNFLPESYLSTLDEMHSYDPDLWRVAFLGHFGTKGRLVLPQFEVSPHAEVMAAVEQIPARYKFVGLDFGFAESYNAVLRLAVDLEQKWLYIYWEYYRNHETDDELADHLVEAGFLRSREVIRCDSAEPKAIAYLQKRGLRAIACKKWNGGSRHARLDNLRKIKRFKKIVCSDACQYCIRELADLTYKADRDEIIIPDEFNRDPHCLSAAFYALDTCDLADVKHNFNKGVFGL